MERFDWQPITELSAPRLLRRLDDRVTYRRGAFIELAESITLADITLERAINVCEEIETARRTVVSAREGFQNYGSPGKRGVRRRESGFWNPSGFTHPTRAEFPSAGGPSSSDSLAGDRASQNRPTRSADAKTGAGLRRPDSR
jgi:hypothetical protein